METVIRNVRDLGADDRSLLERFVGHALDETQQVEVNVRTTAKPSEPSVGALPGIPEWWKVYEGLSDVEVDLLDVAIRQRCNLTRQFE